MDQLTTVWTLLQAHGVVSVFVLAIVNIAIGVAVGLQNETFKLYELDDEFRKLIPFVVAYVAVLFLNNPAMEALVFGAIVASQTAQILKNLALLFPAIAASLPNIVLSPAAVEEKVARAAARRN
jgi:hypothetical protein